MSFISDQVAALHYSEELQQKGVPIGAVNMSLSFDLATDACDGHELVKPVSDAIKDLDALGCPAWDLVDFDTYASHDNMMSMLKGKRYATLFTSRGCPYLCN